MKFFDQSSGKTGLKTSDRSCSCKYVAYATRKKGSTKRLKKSDTKVRARLVSDIDLTEFIKLSKKDLSHLGSLRERQGRRKGYEKISVIEAWQEASEKYGLSWSGDSFELEGRTFKKEEFGSLFVDNATGRLRCAAKRANDGPSTLANFLSGFDKPHLRLMDFLKTDNGPEFLGKFTEWFANRDSEWLRPSHTTSIPEVSNTNAKAEANIYAVKAKMLSNLEGSGFPKSFSDYALKHAYQTINRNRLYEGVKNTDSEHVVQDLFGPRIFDFGEVVIFRDTKTGKRVRQKTNDVTSRGRLGLFMYYSKCRGAVVLDLEDLKIGKLRTIRCATFVHLEERQCARTLIQALSKAWDFRDVTVRRPMAEDEDDDLELPHVSRERTVEFDHDEIFDLPPLNLPQPNELAEFEAHGGQDGGVFSDDDDLEAGEVPAGEDDPGTPDPVVGPDLFNMFSPGDDDLISVDNSGDDDLDYDDDPPEMVESEPSDQGDPVDHADDAPGAGPAPNAGFNPNHGPARAPPRVVWDRGLAYRQNHDNSIGPQLLYDINRTFDTSYIDDFFGSISSCIYRDNVQDWMFPQHSNQYAHKILTKKDPEFWSTAMDDARSLEWSSFEEMDVFDFSAGMRTEWELRQAGERCVGSVCVSSIKDPGLPNSRYKCRITADGAPLKGPSLRKVEPLTHAERRLLMQRARMRNQRVGACDVRNAYLHAPVSCPIWFKVPETICHLKSWPIGTCLLLQKALYGLPDSGSAFDAFCEQTFLSIGFRKIGKSVYRRDSTDEEIGCYVDDFILISDDLDRLLVEINQYMSIPSYDELYAGMSAPIKYNGVELQVINKGGQSFLKESMGHFINNVLSDAKVVYGRTVFREYSTPSIKVDVDLYSQRSEILEALQRQKTPVSSDPHSLVASLLYAAKSCRPDISYPVSVLTRHVGKWSAASDALLLRLLGYLQKNADKGILQPWDAPVGVDISSYGNVISGMSDADLGGCPLSSKSTSGIIIFSDLQCIFGINESIFRWTVDWRSKLQRVTATSTPYAELMAFSLLTTESLRYSQLVSELEGVYCPIRHMTDNTAVLQMIESGYSPALSILSRSLKLTISFLNEIFLNRSNSACYIPTDLNCSDALTKSGGNVLDFIQ